MPGQYEAVASSEDPEEWHRARSSSVTATDLSRLASGGTKVWATVRAEKAGAKSFQGNEYTDYGREREPVIARWAVSELNMVHNTTFFVRDGTNIGATPDLITRDDSLVGDCKTAKLPDDGEWVTPPQGYIDQCLIQMFVMGAEGAALVVEFHKDYRPVSLEPRVYWIDRNEDRLAFLLDLAHQFTNEGPAPVMDALLAEYAEADDMEKRGAAHKADVKARMMDLIGDTPHYKHVSALGSISLIRSEPTQSFDKKKFAESYPELVDQFTVPGRARKPYPKVTIAKGDE